MGKRRGNKGGDSARGPLHDRLRKDELRDGRDASKARGSKSRGKGRHPSGSAPAVRAVASDPLPGDARSRVAIVGGGAAGLAASIAAGDELRAHGRMGEASVVVFEADDRVGRSILATGNGRCNFSNALIDAERYRNSGFVGEVFSALSEDDAKRLSKRGIACDFHEDPVLRLFGDAGLEWREEGDGRLYPATGKASTVVDVLRCAAAILGVREACGRRVEAIEPPREKGGLFHLRFSDGSIEHASAVVLTVGGRHALAKAPQNHAVGGARPAAASLLPEHYGFEPPRLTLGPLAVREAAPRQLDNIRVRARVRLVGGGSPGVIKAEECGEVLFRSYGVSGICIFDLSRFAEPGDILLMDLMPQRGDADLEALLRARRARLASPGGLFGGGRPLTCESFLRGLLLPQVGRAVLEQAGLDPSASMREGDLSVLARTLSGFSLTVEGIGDSRQCQVLRGGLVVGDFEPHAMESRMDPGMFAAGEALDVDAPCGGYNLHWAWASGMLAGASAARHVLKRLSSGGSLDVEGHAAGGSHA